MPHRWLTSTEYEAHVTVLRQKSGYDYHIYRGAAEPTKEKLARVFGEYFAKQLKERSNVSSDRFSYYALELMSHWDNRLSASRIVDVELEANLTHQRLDAWPKDAKVPVIDPLNCYGQKIAAEHISKKSKFNRDKPHLLPHYLNIDTGAQLKFLNNFEGHYTLMSPEMKSAIEAIEPNTHQFIAHALEFSDVTVNYFVFRPMLAKDALKAESIHGSETRYIWRGPITVEAVEDSINVEALQYDFGWEAFWNLLWVPTFATAYPALTIDINAAAGYHLLADRNSRILLVSRSLYTKIEPYLPASSFPTPVTDA
jgi:hypothetical protein